MSGYEPKTIESKWQAVWAEEGTWEVPNPGEPGFDAEKPKAYVCEMLPYPSGEPHVGHLKCYAVGDAIAHLRRRQGFQVVHPMGYDAFGLPAENNAIKTGEPPRVATERSIESFRRQFRSWGVSIDWSREIATHQPEYYRWTQWIFLQLFERGLAYRTEAAVQWCPKDATVLANEQVVDGRCERCGTEVIQKKLEQWFFKITDYADRLLEDFDALESWPEHVITMQRNWIGRSEGAEVVFRCDEVDLDFPVFTTRPDTLFGATFFVLAPEHPQLEKLVAGTPAEAAVREYVDRVGRESVEERGAEDREKTGVPLGRSVVNPVNGEEIPMFVADYVLMEYGTGAIMAVPGHDSRDYDFAKKFDLPVKRVIEGSRPRGARRRRGPAVQRRRADGQLGSLRRPEQSRRLRGDGRVAEGGRARGDRGELPPARLASVTAALLGRADPDRLLRRVRDGAGPRGPAAGRTPRDRGLRAARPEPARRGHRLGDDHVPEVWRRGAAGDRHDGHLRRLLLVLHPLPRSAQHRGAVRQGGRRTTGWRSTSTSAGSSTRSST